MADDSSSLEIMPIESVEQILAVFSGSESAPEPTEEERQRAQIAMLAEMLNAESEEELWRELPTWSSKDFVGDQFRIDACRAYRSKFKTASGGTSAFLSCRAVRLATGELGVLNTSALRLVGRIAWYYTRGKLPVTIEIVKRGETADGYTIVDAELVEALEPVS